MRVRKRRGKDFTFGGINPAWQLPGRYWGWQIKNLPTEYLEWVLSEVKELEHRDVAEIELLRREGFRKGKSTREPKHEVTDADSR